MAAVHVEDATLRLPHWEAEMVCASGCQAAGRRLISAASDARIDEIIRTFRCIRCGGPMMRRERTGSD